MKSQNVRMKNLLNILLSVARITCKRFTIDTSNEIRKNHRLCSFEEEELIHLVYDFK